MQLDPGRGKAVEFAAILRLKGGRGNGFDGRSRNGPGRQPPREMLSIETIGFTGALESCATLTIFGSGDRQGTVIPEMGGLQMLTNFAEAEIVDPALAACEALQVAPIDLKHLRRYTMGNIELEKEILGLFLGQLPETIRSLHEAATEREWHVAAHTLKGSGRAVGAWRVARLAEHAERQLNVMNRPACREAIARIETAAEEARAFIMATYAAV